MVLRRVVGLPGWFAPRAVFPSSRDARHHGVLDQKDSYAAGIFPLAMCSSCGSGSDSLHHGRCGPDGQLCCESWPRSCLRKASIVFLCRGGLGCCCSRARVRGISLGSGLVAVTVPKTADFPQFQLINKVVIILVVVQRPISMVLTVWKTIETP